MINAPGDVNVEIVRTAVESAVKHSTTLIREDTDLLILLLFYEKASDKDLYFRSDKAKACAPYHINELKTNLGDELCSQLLFVHALNWMQFNFKNKRTGFQKLVKGDTTLKACAHPKQTAAEIVEMGRQAMAITSLASFNTEHSPRKLLVLKHLSPLNAYHQQQQPQNFTA